MIAIAIGVAAVLAAAAGLLGLGLVPLWVVALVAGVLALATRIPRTLALALGIGGFLALELGLLMLTPLIGVGMTVPHVAVFVVVSGASAVALRRASVGSVMGGPGGPMLAFAPFVGAGLFLATMALSQVLPGALRLAWAMNGDTVNAMLFSRFMLDAGGIDQVAVPQPTPLPFGMAAANMESGRAGLPDAALLEHDVARTAQVWVLLIALICVLVGVVVARAARGASRGWAVSVTAVASAAPLIWYVVGVQFEFGFMNSSFAMVLLLAAWLAYLGGRSQPVLALVGLFVVALGLLAVWSPLVICVAPLGLVLLVARWRELRQTPARVLLAAALAPVAFLAYAVLVTVPTFLAQSEALGSDGGFPEITDSQILVIIAATVLAIVVAWQRLGGDAPRGALAVLIGFSIGLGYLLLQRQGAVFGWGYYPAKFAWTTSILLLTIAASFVVAVIADSSSRGRARAVLTVAAGAALASLMWGPVLPTAQLPLPRILTGTAFDNQNAAADIVFELSGAKNGQDMLWRTSVGDRWPNSWLLQVDVPDAATNPVRIYAFVPQLSAQQVCEVAGGLPGITVHTSDPAAEADLAATCPDADYSVEVGSY